jgi:uncharacterized membrane protein YfcA
LHPCFFSIAFVFSMLGMGGSQLYIPVLFWLGMLLNVVNSSSAAFTYSRHKLIQWKIARPFGISMVAFAPLGARVNMELPTKPIILVFAEFTALAAATSAIVVTMSGTSSFVSHISMKAQPDWPTWIISAVCVLLGSRIGTRLMAGRLKPGAVKKIFGIVLLAVAGLLIIKDVI